MGTLEREASTLSRRGRRHNRQQDAQQIKEIAGEAELNARLGLKAPKLLSFEEVEEWEQDNEFILQHYRPAFGSR